MINTGANKISARKGIAGSRVFGFFASRYVLRAWLKGASKLFPNRTICTAAIIAADVISVGVSLVIGTQALEPISAMHAGFGAEFYGSAGNGIPPASLISACVAIVFLLGKSHYSRRIPFWTAFQGLLFASAAAAILNSCILALGPQAMMPRAPLLVWCIFPFIALAARSVARTLLDYAGVWAIRTVVIGDENAAAPTLAALASEAVLGYQVVSVIAPTTINLLSTGYSWRALLQQNKAGLVVLCYDAAANPGREMFESLIRQQVPFAIMPQGEGLPVLGFEQTQFFSHDTSMFLYRNNLAKPLARFAKTVFDLVAVSAGLIVLSPWLLILAALVKLDGGPTLYGHTRIGAKGRTFRCLKFRSMKVNSDALLWDLIARDPAAAEEWAQTHKLRNDPRITRIGRILRVTSLDELPQLFNVLRLEMSLVGPRPIVEAEVCRYGDDIAYYYETRPGLTGLWQVSGRTGTSYAQRVQLDTWYVKNWTIWHDIAIIAKTIPAVLKRRGAY